jgi:hypothetical protein
MMTCGSPSEIVKLREENATLRRKLAEREQELVVVYDGLNVLQRQLLNLQKARELSGEGKGSAGFPLALAVPG